MWNKDVNVNNFEKRTAFINHKSNSHCEQLVNNFSSISPKHLIENDLNQFTSLEVKTFLG